MHSCEWPPHQTMMVQLAAAANAPYSRLPSVSILSFDTMAWPSVFQDMSTVSPQLSVATRNLCTSL